MAHLTLPARRDKMVETMLKLRVKNRTLTADSLRLAAHSPRPAGTWVT